MFFALPHLQSSLPSRLVPATQDPHSIPGAELINPQPPPYPPPHPTPPLSVCICARIYYLFMCFPFCFRNIESDSVFFNRVVQPGRWVFRERRQRWRRRQATDDVDWWAGANWNKKAGAAFRLIADISGFVYLLLLLRFWNAGDGFGGSEPGSVAPSPPRLFQIHNISRSKWILAVDVWLR